ncbi:MAG: phosphoribosyl-ATP diphosphatase [Lactobacillales bacterium]|jgi:phosphoribosyl-ATP pyrophosphohydrolase|nr:phosphoribosyl-ATP diphosphatase [Lactobacillales bacterium]
MIEELYETIVERKKNPQPDSYTTYLFEKGLDKILKKVGEEATEVIIAAKNNPEELIYETSDLVYHMLVLLAETGVSLSDVTAELEKREGKLSNIHDRKEVEEL